MAEEQYGMSLDGRSYSILLSGLASTQQPELSKYYFDRALQQGVEPDLILLTSLLNAYVSAATPMMREARQLVHLAKAVYQVEPDIMMYNLLIKGYARTSPPDYEAARELFNTINDSGVLSPTVFTYSMVANAYCSSGLAKDAEEFIREAMALEKVKPNSTTFNTLIKGYARCRCRVRHGVCSCVVCFCSDPDEALRLMNEMEDIGLVPDRITLNVVIESFCSCKQFSQAENIVEQVMRKSPAHIQLRPDVSTYTVLLRGYVSVLLCSLNDLLMAW